VPRAILDPGVLIAALLSPRGTPAQLLIRWLHGEFDLLVSSALLGEVERVLQRPRFRRYVTEFEARSFVSALRGQAVIVDDPEHIEAGLTPDPGDDYLVALARSAGADVIVSGDAHLTQLTGRRPRVLTPRDFMRLLGP
jgi:putative PIN family toxin of toxin-antitoxin system